MTRRGGIIAMLAAAAGIMSKQATLASDLTGTLSASTLTINIPPQSMYFDLASFKEFTFKYKDETITLTPQQIMDAIK